MALREIKSDTFHFFRDELNRVQGEYKNWWENGQIREHSYYVDGSLHGEYKRWYDDGQVSEHCYYVMGERHGEYKDWWDDSDLDEHSLYNMGDLMDIDPSKLSDEDRLMLTLQYNIKFL